MSKIKRYHWGGDESRSGELVLHSDHEAEVARLRAEVEGLRNELASVLEWAIVEKKPLREQEIRSIRVAMGASA